MSDPIVVSEPQVEKTTEEIQKEVIDAGKQAIVSEEIKVEPAPIEVAPAPVVDKAAEEIEKINQTLAKQTELLNTLLNKEDNKAKEKDWTVEELRDAERKCWKGEYDSAEWMPLIAEKRIAIMMASKVDEVQSTMTKDNQWNNVLQAWDAGANKAVTDFGKDASDPNSTLFKTAQNILMSDPAYRKFNEAKAAYENKGMKGMDALRNIDPSIIDPNLQYKCFEIAHSRLSRIERDAPKVPSKGTSKSALGGPTLPKPDADRSQKLEEIATSDPGNTQAWLQLMKADMAKRRGQQ